MATAGTVPFTTALLKYLATTRSRYSARRSGYVRDDVMNATGNQTGALCRRVRSAETIVALVPAPVSPPTASASANADIRRDYELAERVGTKEAWDSFVAAQPVRLLRRSCQGPAQQARRRSGADRRDRKGARRPSRSRRDWRRKAPRSAEQAKAAERSKAAEEARLAAERKKQSEDAKLAAAEQVRLAEQARTAEQPQSGGQNRAASPQTRRSASRCRLAAGRRNPIRPALPDIPRLLQSELRRVGCKTGDIDGEWNASARRALASFNDRAGTRFDVKIASLDALDAVTCQDRGGFARSIATRGFRADGDRCVKITCDNGYAVRLERQLPKDAPERTPRVDAASASRRPLRRGRQMLQSINGTSFCEMKHAPSIATPPVQIHDPAQ